MRRLLSALPAVLLVAGAGGLPAQQQPDESSTLRPHAAAWERMIAAEDARARTDADLNVLLDGLAAPVPALRRVAVRALGRLERADLLETILPLLTDPEPRVRASAADAVAQAVHRSAGPGAQRIEVAREQLLAALADERDASTVAAMAESVGRLRHPDAAVARAVVERLVTYLRGTDEVSLGALRGLYFTARQPSGRGAFGDSARAALQRLATTQSTGPPGERSRLLAIATLTAAGGADAAAINAVLADDPSAHVRREAVAGTTALAENAGARAAILRGLNDSSAVVRFEAVRQYARRLAAQDGCDPVITAAYDDNAHVALQAIDLLGTVCSGDARSGTMLRSIVQNTLGPATDGAADVHARRSAGRALVSLAAADSGAAADAVGRYAADDDVFVRTHAARAAGALADTRLLRRLAADEHPNVRTAAVQELSRTVGHEAAATYLEQLRHDDVELLISVAAALEGSSAPGAAERLLDALDRVTQLRRETSRDARRALLERTGELGNVSLQRRVEPYLRDFDTAVAQLAADLLYAWTGTRPTPAPAPLPERELPTFDEASALERSRIVIEMEGGGVIILRLLPFAAPTNSARFGRLARAGYYDGLTFHRVVPNFVVQGGSPDANEYSGDGPFTRDEVGLISNWRGTVGLSTRGRDTGDAQLYINLIDNVRLDHDYTVFGFVLEGMTVVDNLLEGARIRRVTLQD